MSSAALKRPESAPAAAAPRGDELVRVYVWDVVVRITHWAIAGSIVGLAATGIYIGHPWGSPRGEAVDHFWMGYVGLAHDLLAIVFIASVLARVIWMFTGPPRARWWNFLPVPKERRQGLFPTLSFYLFLRREPPPFSGHNPVAGLTYTAVFGLYAVMILTGLAMHGAHQPVGTLMHGFVAWMEPFGGLPGARWIHHVAMWLLLGFAVHHVYSATLVSNVERTGTVDSIFSGYKWMKRKDADR